jgi:hypothetical protein
MPLIEPWRPRSAAMFLLAVSFACGHATPAYRSTSSSGEVELTGLSYDGTTIRGRLLVRARDQAILLDPRWEENAAVGLSEVMGCSPTALPALLVVDHFPPPLSPKDVLRLEPGYWYGRDVTLHVFRDPGPSCIKASISVAPVDPTGRQMQPDGWLQIQVEARTR